MALCLVNLVCVFSPGDLIFNDIQVKGFWLVHWFATTTHEEREQLYGELAKLLTDGKLQASIDHTYPLTEFKQAIELATRGLRDGKVVFLPQQDGEMTP